MHANRGRRLDFKVWPPPAEKGTGRSGGSGGGRPPYVGNMSSVGGRPCLLASKSQQGTFGNCVPLKTIIMMHIISD